MFRKHLSQQRVNEPHELDITPFLNLMVALVPFLLVTAVFSRVAILELNLPNAEAEAENDNKQTIEIIIRETELELGDGSKVLSRYKKHPQVMTLQDCQRYWYLSSRSIRRKQMQQYCWNARSSMIIW